MRSFIFAFVFAAFAAAPAFAWGPTGHRITGTIAEQNLSGVARARIALILGPETLADASTWPDEMRSDPSPFWQSTANPWHYVTAPKGRAYTPATAPPEGDAVTALGKFAQTLNDPKVPREQKQLALRFIVHIIGDLHQPLHAGNGQDHGGNDLKVTFFGEQTNLHQIWDSRLIDHQQLSYSEYAARLIRTTSPQDIIDGSTPDPLVWISESAALRDQVYPNSTSLSWNYVFQSKPLMDARLRLAGIRMAAYLNALFAR